jgi:predicted metal-dependent phosphoesterase TrpH
MQHTKIDMHIHTTASDGKDTPEEVVQKAKKAGLKLISITDHDTISALETARNCAQKEGITFINGVELSVVYEYNEKKEKKCFELHLLGYGFDDQNPELASLLQASKEFRVKRARRILERVNEVLKKEGKEPISIDEFERARAKNKGSFGRPHLALLLKEHKLVEGIQEAFDEYLNRCNLPKKRITFETASEILRKAGGKVVLAHPYGEKKSSLVNITKELKEQEKIIIKLHKYLDGLECYYPDHTPEQTKFYVELANKLGLFVTGGSDHHGGEREGIR